MIIRPESDVELLCVVRDIFADRRLEPDTRCLLAALMCRREVEFFPNVAALGKAVNMDIGPERARRMLNELRGAGYLLRAFWRVPYDGHRPLYTSLCGQPGDIAIAAAKFTVGKRARVAR